MFRKKVFSYVLVVLLIFNFLPSSQNTVYAANINHQTSIRLGGTTAANMISGPTDIGLSVTTDINGNVIMTGIVFGNADLNGNATSTDGGAETASSTYTHGDIFISSFTSSSVFQWSKRLGGTFSTFMAATSDAGYSVVTDSQGNVIVAGQVYGNADLNGDGDSTDGGAETASSTYGSSTDIFISSFTSTGTFKWTKRLGGTAGDGATSVIVDQNDNIIVTGHAGVADLNGDGDSNDGAVEQTAYTAQGDVVISSFTTEGVFQWTKRLGGSNYSGGNSVTTDSNSNVIVTGYVKGDADLNGNATSTDGGAETASSTYQNNDIFLSSFTSTGTYKWSKRLGGAGADFGLSVTTDNSNNVIVTGYVVGAADLNGDGDSNDGGTEATSSYAGTSEPFISSFTTEGVYQWSQRLGAASGAGRSIITDSSDNIIVTGEVSGDADLNGDGSTDSSGAESALGYGGNDIFVTSFSSAGTFKWSQRLGGSDASGWPAEDIGYSVARDANDTIYNRASVW